MEDLRQRTKDPTKQLCDNGYQVVEIWACEWKSAGMMYKKWMNVVGDGVVVEPLNP